jgi:hypothetical protein
MKWRYLIMEWIAVDHYEEMSEYAATQMFKAFSDKQIEQGFNFGLCLLAIS